MTGYLLRDMKRNTELLILAEFLKNPSVKRREIAEKLGITEQAISQYIADLERESLLATAQGNPKPTRKGVQLLQERFVQLNEEIKAILRQIQVIDTCVALAGAPIRAKERVALVMRGGRLVAIPSKKSASVGIARSDAEKGEEVQIGNLEGVVDLKLGELLAFQIPTVSSGGSRNVDYGLASRAMKAFRFDEVAVGDVIAEVIAKRLRLAPTMLHAPVQSTVTALSKGLNVLFIGTHESIEGTIEAIERLKHQTGYSISYRLADIGKKAKAQ